ncbi:hypothetical protein CQW23_05433 [Capsicum baccatum]|uniref:Uncharacterized protein n=1 Tax=Capsicum baccatum TaxID=33114 RepID=A0A2G2XHJ5_CAPBA|nr:hypothetical protein CQW23_05433 [Capsicum baccatum]
MGATRCVMPRQACPRPNGFGCTLRSKNRWFTGFCNSHQVSHFAMFFIHARAEISTVESRFHLQKNHRSPRCMPQMGREGKAIYSSILWRFPRRGSLLPAAIAGAHVPGTVRGARAECRSTPPAWTPQLLNAFAGSFCCAGFDNDPLQDQPGSIPHRFCRRRMSPAFPRRRRRIQGEHDRRLQGESYGEDRSR